MTNPFQTSFVSLCYCIPSSSLYSFCIPFVLLLYSFCIPFVFLFVFSYIYSVDRKIEFPYPDEKTRRRIFGIHMGKMSCAEDVNLEEFVTSKDDISGADIKAICTEAGLLALRERRMKVTQTDFRKAKERALYKKKGQVPDGLYL